MKVTWRPYLPSSKVPRLERGYRSRLTPKSFITRIVRDGLSVIRPKSLAGVTAGQLLTSRYTPSVLIRMRMLVVTFQPFGICLLANRQGLIGATSCLLQL